MIKNNDRDSYSIGRRKTGRSGLVGAAIIYLLMTLLAGPVWFVDLSFAPAIVAGLIAFGFAIYWLGGVSGHLILVKRWNAGITGIVTAFLIVWLSALAGGLAAFVITDTSSWSGSWLQSYTLKPVGAFTFWGGIPILILGLWSGLSIEKHLKN